MSQANPSTSARNLAGADVLRATAVISVIIIHAAHWQRPYDGIQASIAANLTALARFSVPAFMLLSGLLLAYRKPTFNTAWLQRRLTRTLLPFMVWVVIYIGFGLLVTHGLRLQVSSITDWLLGGSGHLYYLLLAPQLFVLAMLYFPRSDKGYWIAAVVLVVWQLVFDTWRLYGKLPSGSASNLIIYHAYQLVFTWLGYAAVGMLIGRHIQQLDRLRAWYLLPLTVALAFVFLVFGDIDNPRSNAGGATGIYLAPLLMPFTISLSLLLLGPGRSLMTTSSMRRFIDTTSRHSLGIYVIHPALVSLIGMALAPTLPGGGDPVALLTFLVRLGGAYAGAWLIARLIAASSLRWAVGETR